VPIRTGTQRMRLLDGLSPAPSWGRFFWATRRSKTGHSHADVNGGSGSQTHIRIVPEPFPALLSFGLSLCPLAGADSFTAFSADGGTQIRVTSSDSSIIDPDQEIPMRSKLAISALVVASFLGATVIASAQTEPAQPAPGATGQGKTGSKMAPDRMKSSNMKRGTTTGAAQGMTPGSRDESKPGGRSTARNPPD
jgi:hypothetical protein